ncbi:hypothetical protein [Sphingomonas morindae]|uniref:Uncharacterized protein n=1 Tax=Sphingomonas morindae TaxID=1541170 RepID=A0ABY4XAL8_9SPHN|nr:hypothetical protein [Sphingomonas morindae]USI74012.1 hypothetical protein LHA26_05990 [Sphingomonas morindae]
MRIAKLSLIVAGAAASLIGLAAPASAERWDRGHHHGWRDDHRGHHRGYARARWERQRAWRHHRDNRYHGYYGHHR